MVQIFRNVGGIEGLHLAKDCFTEEVERRIFTSIDESRYQSGKRTWGGEPTGLIRWPYDWPEDYIKLTNLIRDCGLLPDYVPPDYCLRLMYPPKAGFQFHHDSQYRWGEVIVGVNLGQEGELMFTPDREEDAFDTSAFTTDLASKAAGVGKSVRVKLPRRSIYVMSGASRYVYKHGIAQQKPTLPPPSWNTLNMRKSLTFRSTKVFSDVYLERKLADNNLDATRRVMWQTRKEAQDKYKPKGNKAEVAQERQNASALLNMIDSGIIPAQLRFAQHEVTFPLPPGVVVTQQRGAFGNYSSGGFGTSGSGRSVAAASVPPAVAPARAAAAAAFQGEGRQLGCSANNSGVGDDDIMQMAINASLRSLAEEREARAEKRKRKRDTERSGSGDRVSASPCEESPKKDGGVIDLVGEDDEDNKEGGNRNDKKSSDVIVIYD